MNISASKSNYTKFLILQGLLWALYEGLMLWRMTNALHSFNLALIRSLFSLTMVMSATYLNLLVILPYFLKRKRMGQYGIIFAILVAFVIMARDWTDPRLFGVSPFEKAQPIFNVRTLSTLVVMVGAVIIYFLFKDNDETLITNSPITNLPISEHLLIKSAGKIEKIPFEDILFVESQKEYVEIHTRHGKKYTMLGALKRLQEEMPQQFIRIHKSYIASMTHAHTIETPYLVLTNQQKLPIGDLYKEEVMRRFVG